VAKAKKKSGASDASAEPTTDSPAPSAKPAGQGGRWDGAALRSAREKSGLSVEEVSARTKINIAILKALEEERFEDTPKARVYVRGFVRCMAEEIGVDPEAVARGYVPRWEAWFAQHEPAFEP